MFGCLRVDSLLRRDDPVRRSMNISSQCTLSDPVSLKMGLIFFAKRQGSGTNDDFDAIFSYIIYSHEEIIEYRYVSAESKKPNVIAILT